MAGIWYRVGTVALTNGSKRVTGTGTSWQNQATGPIKGNIFLGPDGRQYEIDEVLSNTTLDLVEVYAGATASGQSYRIVTPIKGTVAALASQVTATLQYAQGQYGNMSNWAASDLPADVPVILPNGVSTKNVPNLAKMNASINAKLTHTPQLAALDVPSSAFGRARLNDVSAAATVLAIGAYAKANILGPVAQAGGVPTGAIIEQGSNAGGRYVRFADGTQICFSSGMPMSFANVSNLRCYWGYPATFVGTPMVLPQIDLSNFASRIFGSVCQVYSREILPYGVAVGLASNGLWLPGDETIVPIGAVAVGRWF